MEKFQKLSRFELGKIYGGQAEDNCSADANCCVDVKCSCTGPGVHKCESWDYKVKCDCNGTITELSCIQQS